MNKPFLPYIFSCLFFPKTLHLLRGCLVYFLFTTACTSAGTTQGLATSTTDSTEIVQQPIITGAQQIDVYSSMLAGKRVALVVNHTAMVNNKHLLDTLLSLKVQVVKVFTPEHGFRGDADAGETVKDSTDSRTGVKVVSLYGKKKQPDANDLRDVDVVVFDIQDVGARFYTYISTLHYVMESCARYKKTLVVLDRPNPNGDYIDGPVLDVKNRSFVGMHPIPIVHGLTVGELAQMINGERWLKDSLQCQLNVVTVANYTHATRYELPVAPSPNLPNYAAVRLYPSLCLFEATNFSVGRGTNFPFQVVGYPDSCYGRFSFTPVSIEGKAKTPLHQDKQCFGIDLRTDTVGVKGFTLQYLLAFYNQHKKCNNATPFFDRPQWLTLLVGTNQLQEQIQQGLSEADIRASWLSDLEQYKKKRTKYLLYKD